MTKANYVDGFVLMIPKKNMAAYKKMASEAGKIWRKHGALDYKECIIDDSKPKGVQLPFGKLTKVKPTESVWFSYITFKNRAHRDRVNVKVMKDPAMSAEKWKDTPMPFEMNRMAYAGFKVIVNA